MEARPRVWWHWMNGNVTINGIQKDLDWMEKSGIAGFQNFDANLMTPVVVDKKLVYMIPDWKDAFLFTTQLANKKGMEMTIAGSPSWSVTGGPWVEPQDAMKKYVWSETYIKGEKKVSISLNPLPDEIGIMQNIPIEGSDLTGGTKTIKQYGQKIAVFAIPNIEIDFEKNQPKISPTLQFP